RCLPGTGSLSALLPTSLSLNMCNAEFLCPARLLFTTGLICLRTLRLQIHILRTLRIRFVSHTSEDLFRRREFPYFSRRLQNSRSRKSRSRQSSSAMGPSERTLKYRLPP